MTILQYAKNRTMCYHFPHLTIIIHNTKLPLSMSGMCPQGFFALLCKGSKEKEKIKSQLWLGKTVEN